MTLENTRAAGLRQAADLLTTRAQMMDERIDRQTNTTFRAMLCQKRRTLFRSAALLDRLAQEAESDGN